MRAEGAAAGPEGSGTKPDFLSLEASLCARRLLTRQPRLAINAAQGFIDNFLQVQAVEVRHKVFGTVKGAVHVDLLLNQIYPGIDVWHVGQNLFKGLGHQGHVPEVLFFFEHGVGDVIKEPARQIGIVHRNLQEVPVGRSGGLFVLRGPLFRDLPVGNDARANGQQHLQEAGGTGPDQGKPGFFMRRRVSFAPVKGAGFGGEGFGSRGGLRSIQGPG